MKHDYDVIIIGAGGAGMAAAIYTGRYELKTAVFTKDIGGQAATTESIENYPGIEKIGGMEIMENFHKHAEKSGAEFKFEAVTKIEHLGEGKGFKITTEAGEYTSEVLIVSAGMKHRKLGVPGEDKFEGKGVAYCATCDAPLFKDKVTAVVGGGNSALEAAEFLSRVATKVYGIVRDGDYTGEAKLLDTVKNHKKIEIIYESETVEIKGDKFVEGIVIKNKAGEQKEIPVQGVFVEIGWQADTEWLGDLVERNKWGEIIVTEKAETKTPGLYAAGDITNIFTKQLVASAGQGCLAALRAIQYIREGK